MEIQTAETIWVAEKDKTTLFATYTFDEMLEVLYKLNYIAEYTLVYTEENKVCCLLGAYGKNWKKVLSSFSAKKINEILLTDIEIKQIDVKVIE